MRITRCRTPKPRMSSRLPTRKNVRKGEIEAARAVCRNYRTMLRRVPSSDLSLPETGGYLRADTTGAAELEGESP